MTSGKRWGALILAVGLAVAGCSGGSTAPGTGSGQASGAPSATGSTSVTGSAAVSESTGTPASRQGSEPASGRSSTPDTASPSATQSPGGSVTGSSAAGPDASGTTSTSAGPSTPAAGDTAHAHLSAALATVPGSATEFMFVDHAAMKREWGVPDLDSSVDVGSAEWNTFLQHAKNAPGGGLDQYLVVMAKDWGWSSLDVVWEVSPHADDRVTVYRLRDDLDMTTVTGSLADHGYTRSGPDDRPSFKVDLSQAKGTPPFLAATVLPTEHLLITGDGPDDVLAAIDDPSSSLAGNDTVGRLMDGAPDPQYLSVMLGVDACALAEPDLMSTASPSAVVASMKAKLDSLADLHPIDGVAAMTVSDTDAVVSIDFPSAEHAEADVDARSTLLATATSARTGQPLSDLYTVAGTAVHDRVLRFTLTFTSSSGALASMVMSRDTPWAVCP